MTVSAADVFLGLPPVRESLVVVELRDGLADGRLVHLPVPTRPFGIGVQRVEDSSAYDWTARCGVVGVVYAHAGLFEGAPVCPDCQAAA